MELTVKILLVVEYLLNILLWPFYLWYERRQPKRIPYRDDELLKISAVKLAEAIRNGKIKSEQIVKAYITRIQEVNPVLNAVSDERFALAIDEAKKVDATIANGEQSSEELQKKYPLLGVPITIKESCGLEGMTFAVGSLERVGARASKSGEAVSNILAAGAIPLVVTTTPEYCLSWDTNNHVTGRTVNAYNTYRTSGGSSGGEGALLGAGASVIGIGSDIAGSIRVPAHFNGIFGHKPTGGIVSVKGHFPQSTDEKIPEYLVIGPMTRYSEDLKPMLKILAGANAEKLNLDENVDLSKIKVLYMHNMSTDIIKSPVQKEIRMAVKKAAVYLKDGCKSKLSKTKFNELENSMEYGVSIFFSDLPDMPDILKNPDNPKESANLWLEILKGLVGQSNFSLHALFMYALRETNIFVPRLKTSLFKVKFAQLTKQMESALGCDGVFLYPTFPTTAFNLTGMLTRASGVAYTMMFNLMGFPCTTVPLGFDDNNLPIGIQVVAARNQDRLCLAVAQELEKHFGGWIPPPMSSKVIV